MYTILDLFAGAGGLTRGFTDTGRFRPLYAVELDEDARQSYILNFHPNNPNNVLADVTQVSFRDFPVRPDVIIGGPPCQDFTQLTAVRREVDRQRNELLWEHYLKLVLHLRPQAFVIENVPNLLTDGQYESQRRMLRQRLEAAGYQLAFDILTASAFGVPQSRRRAFIIGTSTGRAPHLPLPTLEYRTAWDELKKLQDEPLRPLPKGKVVLAGRDLHIGRQAEVLSRLRYRYILPGGNRLNIPSPVTIKTWATKSQGTFDGYGRINATRPSPTIRCEAYKPEKGRFLHPFLNRPLTLAEMAVLQTFPEEHLFFGTFTSIARQIGNAVPPLLARRVAEAVASALDREEIRVVARKAQADNQQRLGRRSSGKNAQEKILKLLSKNVGKPVPWFEIEDCLRTRKDHCYPDWATPLQDLINAGYPILVGNGSNGLAIGEYSLTASVQADVYDRPDVRRLLSLVESQRPRVCERCGASSGAIHATIIRSPLAGGLLMPDNVEMVCDKCRSKLSESRLPASLTEERVLNWLAVFRHYPPVRDSVAQVLGISVSEMSPGQGPCEWDDPQVRLADLARNATTCDLCGQASSTLTAEIIRPRSAGGLYVDENAWVICHSCRSELDQQMIKVPSEVRGHEKAGRMVSLRSRFSEPGFLTPKEAYYRNWLLLHRRDPVILQRARTVMLTGQWD